MDGGVIGVCIVYRGLGILASPKCRITGTSFLVFHLEDL